MGLSFWLYAHDIFEGNGGSQLVYDYRIGMPIIFGFSGD